MVWQSFALGLLDAGLQRAALLPQGSASGLWVAILALSLVLALACCCVGCLSAFLGFVFLQYPALVGGWLRKTLYLLLGAPPAGLRRLQGYRLD